jgi:hypothetical protein
VRAPTDRPYLSRVRLALVSLWLVYTIVLGKLYALLPESSDLQLFDYVGWVVATGGSLYVDASEQNWPGALWLHTLAIWLFGPTAWAYRTLDFALATGGALVLGALLRARGARLAGLVVVPLYQAMYVSLNVWMSGQRDIVAAHVLCVAAWSYLRGAHGGHRWRWLAGCAIAFAVLVRPTYLLFAPIGMLADIVTRPRSEATAARIVRDLGHVAVGFVALMGVVVAVTSADALAGWRAAAVDFNLQAYPHEHTPQDVTDTLRSLAYGWRSYLVLGALGIAWWVRSGERRVLAQLVAVALTGVLSAFVQGKGHIYHFGGLAPVLAMLMAYIIAELCMRAHARPSRLRMGMAALVLGVGSIGLATEVRTLLAPQVRYLIGASSPDELLATSPDGALGHTPLDTLRAVQYVAQHAAPRDTVLVWARFAAINTLSRRRAPTRFITTGMLELAEPPFAHAQTWNDELERALTGPTPPAILFAPGRDHEDHQRVLVDASPARALRTLRTAIHTRYRRDTHFGDLDAYRLVR